MEALTGGGVASKSSLRSAMKEKLSSLDATFVADAGARLADRVEKLPEVRAAGGVLACWSFGVEIPTQGLIRRLVAAGKEVYLPRILPPDPESQTTPAMTLHRFPCDLERLVFGLEQPVASAPVLEASEVDTRVDVALILGLAYDGNGFRLGYGGGYFDRFFARYRALAIGLGFACQRVERLPREEHDLPMRLVVTESATWRT